MERLEIEVGSPGSPGTIRTISTKVGTEVVNAMSSCTTTHVYKWLFKHFTGFSLLRKMMVNSFLDDLAGDDPDTAALIRKIVEKRR